MASEKFVPKVGARLSAAQAEFIGSVATRHGGIEGEHAAPALVDASRSRNSPTHKLFQWNDAKAAEEYRIARARQLIGSVMIVVEEDKDGLPMKTAPAFVSLRVAGESEKVERYYFPSRHAMSDDALREQVLTEVDRRLRAAKLYAGAIKELAAIVDTAIAETARLRKKNKPLVAAK